MVKSQSEEFLPHICPTDPERKKGGPAAWNTPNNETARRGLSLRPVCGGRGEGFIVGPRGTLPICSRAGLILFYTMSFTALPFHAAFLVDVDFLPHKITVLWG
jgi:hypothetical protein